MTTFQNVWPVNELGEIVAATGVGSSSVTGFVNQDQIPTDSSGNVKIAGMAQLATDAGGNSAKLQIGSNRFFATPDYIAPSDLNFQNVRLVTIPKKSARQHHTAPALQKIRQQNVHIRALFTKRTAGRATAIGWLTPHTLALIMHTKIPASVQATTARILSCHLAPQTRYFQDRRLGTTQIRIYS
jgi:hypothetical protein